MLYTLFQTPAHTDTETLLAILTETDAVLLLQDGVTAAIKKTSFLTKLTASPAKIFALQPDIIARGLTHLIDPQIILIDYNGFVELTEEHSNQVVW